MTQRYFVELPRLVRRTGAFSHGISFVFAVGSSSSRTTSVSTTRCWEQLDFNRLKPHELHALYREMETALLWNWRAPIINDFFVMVYYGMLKKMILRRCGTPIAHYGFAVYPAVRQSNSLLKTPERVEVPILTIIKRKKVFTVLGLTFIRHAISLLVNPSSNS